MITRAYYGISPIESTAMNNYIEIRKTTDRTVNQKREQHSRHWKHCMRSTYLVHIDQTEENNEKLNSNLTKRRGLSAG